MDLKSVESLWESNAKKDALWSNLSMPEKIWEGEKELKEFFEIGKRDVDHYMLRLEEFGGLKFHNCAIDFGCGVGRLSRRLAAYFDEVIGIDISQSMLRKAKELNSELANCKFQKLDMAGLNKLPSASFDFIIAILVLQHLPPKYSCHYIREFLRLAKPEAIIIFQTPTHRVLSARNWLRSIVPNTFVHLRHRWLKPDRPFIPMYGLQRELVISLVEACQGEILDICWDDLAGSDWHSQTYYCRKVASSIL